MPYNFATEFLSSSVDMHLNSAAHNVAHQEKDTRKRLEINGVSPMTVATSLYTFLPSVDWQLLSGFH